MGSRRAGLSRSALLRFRDKGIIERHESDSIGIVRPRLKLTPDGSMNAQRHFWPRTSLIGRHLFPCNLVGRAVNFNSLRSHALPGNVRGRRLENTPALAFWHGPQSAVSVF